ncbi:MAG: GntR family transcriptional regulator [Hyphomonadaceae bacterium]|nr:GntR family transcriptional regulator [Hyphomonadaceae bacterium]
MAGELGVTERVYATLREAILNGSLRAREHLDIEAIAARLKASATPVRHALAILTVERLVKVTPGKGYSVAFWSERELAVLYLWRGQLAVLASAAYEVRPLPSNLNKRPYVEALAAVFTHIEDGRHTELSRAIAAADARLTLARAAEPEVLDRLNTHLRDLIAATQQSRAKLQAALRRHFKVRVREAARIRARAGLAALPRNGE